MIDINRLPKQGYGYIYEYTSPNGKKYIGQTTTSLIKRSGKRGQGYLGCKVFYNAIKKYGFENFIPDIIGEFLISDLNEKEQYYIKEKNTFVPNGYNLKDGGQNTGRFKNPIYAYNLDGTFYKEYFNEADVRREFNVNGSDISKCLDGKLHYARGKIWKRQYSEKVEPVLTTKNGGKPVIQIDPITNEIIEIYDSASAASRALGLKRSDGISKCCTGKSKISAGFKWQFLQSLTTKDS